MLGGQEKNYKIYWFFMDLLQHMFSTTKRTIVKKATESKANANFEVFLNFTDFAKSLVQETTNLG